MERIWILTPSGEGYLDFLRRARISASKDLLRNSISKENILNYFILDGLSKDLPFFEIEEVLNNFRSTSDSSEFLQISLKRFKRQGWVKELKGKNSEEEVPVSSEVDDFLIAAFPKIPSSFKDFEDHF